MRTRRLVLYVVLAMWLGSTASANFNDILDGFVLGVVTTSALIVGQVAGLVLMYRYDRRRDSVAE